MGNYLNSSNLVKPMGKLNVMFLFIFLVSLTLVSAEVIGQRQDGSVNQPYVISQPCASCSYINISVFNEDGAVLSNVAMIDNGSAWTYTFTPTNRTRYDVNGIGDINGVDDSFAFFFNVDPINVGATIMLLVLFSGVIVGISIIHKRTDFEKWHDKIMNSDKTFIKSSLATIPYTLMKDVFLIYYLLGFPIIFLVTDLITYYNLSSIAYMFTIFGNIYTVGLVLPGLFILSNAIKFIVDMYEKRQKDNWGII